jgi:hypothetical protein
MFRITHYFIDDEGGGRRGPFRDRSEAGALAAAAALRGRTARVWAVTGEPMFDLWEEPRLVEAHSAGRSERVQLQPTPDRAQVLQFTPRSRRP